MQRRHVFLRRERERREVTVVLPHHRRFIDEAASRFTEQTEWSWRHGRPPLDES
jgi:hypothetical protein